MLSIDGIYKTSFSEYRYKAGKLHGACRTFYASGALCRSEFFVEGRREGLQESFYESGQLRTIERYEAGVRVGEALLFWPNGQLKRRWIASGKDQLWNEAGDAVD